MLKRLFDIICSGIGLLLLLPLFFVVAIIIAITDGLPIFFCQIRVGKNGTDFSLLKFRTMKVQKNSEKGSFDVGCSARVTSIGKLLRKTKIDELPQLWNVFKGDMSLVGPRPEVKKWVDAYPERWKFVLSVKPGITDTASIKFRNEEEILEKANDPHLAYKDIVLPQKLTYYEEYIKEQSLWGDIKIIFQTILVIVKD